MQEIILSDVTTFFKLLCVLFLAFASNVVFSLFYNTTNQNEKFEKEKFFRGIMKCLVFVIGSTLLILAIDFAVFVFDKYGIVSESVGEIITVASMFISLGIAIVKYIKDAFETYVQILTDEK